MALGLQPSAEVHRQPTADTCHLSLDKLVAPEPLGKANTFIADFVNSREGNVNFSDVDVGGVCGAACFDSTSAGVLVVAEHPVLRCSATPQVSAVGRKVGHLILCGLGDGASRL